MKAERYADTYPLLCLPHLLYGAKSPDVHYRTFCKRKLKNYNEYWIFHDFDIMCQNDPDFHITIKDRPYEYIQAVYLFAKQYDLLDKKLNVTPPLSDYFSYHYDAPSYNVVPSYDPLFIEILKNYKKRKFNE